MRGLRQKTTLAALMTLCTLGLAQAQEIQGQKMKGSAQAVLTVYVGNLDKFTALPGASSGSYAVKISSINRGEE